MNNPDELLEIGDKVVFRVEPERQSYSDVEDGMIGVVCGFSYRLHYEPRYNGHGNVPPGIYHTRDVADILLPSGYVVHNRESRSFTKIEEASEDRHSSEHPPKMTRLGDLPETPFWEQDVVEVCDRTENWVGIIERINYWRTPPSYEISRIDRKGWADVDKGDFRLKQRGNLWQSANNCPSSGTS